METDGAWLIVQSAALRQQIRNVLTHPDHENLRQRADNNQILRDLLKTYEEALGPN